MKFISYPNNVYRIESARHCAQVRKLFMSGACTYKVVIDEDEHASDIFELYNSRALKSVIDCVRSELRRRDKQDMDACIADVLKSIDKYEAFWNGAEAEDFS